MTPPKSLGPLPNLFLKSTVFDKNSASSSCKLDLCALLAYTSKDSGAFVSTASMMHIDTMLLCSRLMLSKQVREGGRINKWLCGNVQLLNRSQSKLRQLFCMELLYATKRQQLTTDRSPLMSAAHANCLQTANSLFVEVNSITICNNSCHGYQAWENLLHNQ